MTDGPSPSTAAAVPPPPPTAGAAVVPDWAVPVRELESFRSLTPWRHAAIVLVGITTALSAIGVLLGWNYAAALDGLANGTVTAEEAIIVEGRFVIQSVLIALFWLASLVASIGWLYVAAKNAEIMRPGECEHTPKWAIWGWFVPFLNLFRPVAMVQQVWDQCRGGAKTWGGVPSLIRTWWGLLIVHFVLDRIATAQVRGAWAMEEVANAQRWGAVASAALVPAGVAFVLVIHHVTARHESAIVEFSADPSSLASYPRAIRHAALVPDNGATLARNHGW